MSVAAPGAIAPDGAAPANVALCDSVGVTMPRRDAGWFACSATRVVFAVIAFSAATFVSLAIVLHSAPHHRSVASGLPWQLDPKRAARVQRAVANHAQGPPEFPMDGSLAGADAVVMHHDSMRATVGAGACVPCTQQSDAALFSVRCL